MKKTLLTILSIFLLAMVLTISARALFSANVSTASMSFSTGNADLKISSDGSTWQDTFSFVNDYSNLSSGFTGVENFYLKNQSLSPITLKVSSTLEDHSPAENGTSWNIIGDKIFLKLEKKEGDNWTQITNSTLKQWRDISFVLGNLTQNSFQQYRLLISLADLENLDSTQALSNLSFKFSAIQVN